MNNAVIAAELVKIASALAGSPRQAGPRVRNLQEGIAQAKANAARFNATFYVNSTSDGIRVEREPVTQSWAGNKTLAAVSPDGKVKSASVKQAAIVPMASDWQKIENTLRTARRMMEDAESKLADLKQIYALDKFIGREISNSLVELMDAESACEDAADLANDRMRRGV